MSTQLQWGMRISNRLYLTSIAILLLSACDPQTGNHPAETGSLPVSMERTGWLASNQLNEASGLLEPLTIWGEAPPAKASLAPQDCWALRRWRGQNRQKRQRPAHRPPAQTEIWRR